MSYRDAMKDFFIPGILPAAEENLKKEYPDPTNPDHYKQGKIECIDAIESALTLEEFAGFCKGNVIKYNWRSKHKDGVEALEKAGWYQARLIEFLKKNYSLSSTASKDFDAVLDKYGIRFSEADGRRDQALANEINKQLSEDGFPKVSQSEGGATKPLEFVDKIAEEMATNRQEWAKRNKIKIDVFRDKMNKDIFTGKPLSIDLKAGLSDGETPIINSESPTLNIPFKFSKVSQSECDRSSSSAAGVNVGPSAPADTSVIKFKNGAEIHFKNDGAEFSADGEYYKSIPQDIGIIDPARICGRSMAEDLVPDMMADNKRRLDALNRVSYLDNLKNVYSKALEDFSRILLCSSKKPLKKRTTKNTSTSKLKKLRNSARATTASSPTDTNQTSSTTSLSAEAKRTSSNSKRLAKLSGQGKRKK